MPVHLRLNDKDTTRNPYINFVTALPGPSHDEALHRLQQLAAMVKPLMKHHGFHVNSLEQYEWNREFAGRCWNNGEVVELVLTSEKGAWMPLQYVLYVFCHELAHVKHMNHIYSQHGALTRELKQMALEKQRQGYYGDGLWSAGRKLGEGGFVEGLGMQQQNRDSLPQHVCGGAFKRKTTRSAGRKRRRTNGTGKRKYKGPSRHTGAQTAPKTRGGNRRVTLEVAANGGSDGTRVDGRNWLPTATAKDASYKQDENSTFRKRTQSKDAREKRANAALARFAAAAAVVEEEQKMASSSAASTANTRLIKDDASDLTSDDEGSDSDSVTEDEDVKPDIACGIDLPDKQQFTQGWEETAEQRLRRLQRFEHRQESSADGAKKVKREDEWDFLLEDGDATSAPANSEMPAAHTEIIDDDDEHDEIVFVEERPAKRLAHWQETERTSRSSGLHTQSAQWECLLCTLVNPATHTRCAACGTTRGKTTLGA